MRFEIRVLYVLFFYIKFPENDLKKVETWRSVNELYVEV